MCNREQECERVLPECRTAATRRGRDHEVTADQFDGCEPIDASVVDVEPPQRGSIDEPGVRADRRDRCVGESQRSSDRHVVGRVTAEHAFSPQPFDESPSDIIVPVDSEQNALERGHADGAARRRTSRRSSSAMRSAASCRSSALGSVR